MNSVPISLLYASITGLIFVGLGLNVSRVRGITKTSVTDAPNAQMLRTIRAHANTAEWAPMMLLLLLVLELAGGKSLPLHLFGGAIALSRLTHGVGLILKNRMSVIGATLTYALMIAMPIYGLILRFH